MKLDDTASAPAYVKVADAIRAAIADGELAPGAQLPSGPKLAEQFGVAPMTVRRAIEMLRSEGRLRSSHGVGVFVSAEGAKVSELDALRSTVEQLAKRVDHLERETGIGASVAQPE
jgi:DNA-binding GntR family transcriptional regulator